MTFSILAFQNKMQKLQLNSFHNKRISVIYYISLIFDYWKSPIWTRNVFYFWHLPRNKCPSLYTFFFQDPWGQQMSFVLLLFVVLPLKDPTKIAEYLFNDLKLLGAFEMLLSMSYIHIILCIIFWTFFEEYIFLLDMKYDCDWECFAESCSFLYCCNSFIHI